MARLRSSHENQLDAFEVAAQVAAATPVERPAVILENWRRQGSFFVADDGALMVEGRMGPEGAEVPIRHVDRVKHLCQLRDAVRRVLHAELANAPEFQLTELRAALNEVYDRFVATYGPINLESANQTRIRQPNLWQFESDPDCPLVSALEVVNIEEQTYEKAPIFSRPVIRQTPEPVKAESPSDALAISLDRKGGVDVSFMAALLSKSEGETIEELAGVIYYNPEARRYETASEYLAGPVRAKLATARAAAEKDKRFLPNVQALEAVQPADLTQAQIAPALGAPWIPATDIQDFVRHLLNAKKDDQITVRTDNRSAQWSVRVSNRALLTSSRATRSWGTRRMNAVDLLLCALNQTDPVVRDPIPNTDPRKYIVNQDETLAAREKLADLRAEFGQWLWATQERTVRLVTDYNARYNDRVERVYDGSHLSLPGASDAVTLRPHQKNAIWRALQNGNTLLAHEVGTGKAQPLDAKVLTPKGWKQMGDIQVGDTVIAGDGTPTTVLGVYPQGEKDIFRVVMSDGSSTECCDEHLWLTQTYRERIAAINEQRFAKSEWPSARPKIRPLSEIRTTLRASHLNAKNHSIPVVGAVQMAAQPVPLDPYVLGVLLGDGCLTGKSPSLSSADPEIIEAVRRSLPAEHTLSPAGDGSYDYGIVRPDGDRWSRRNLVHDSLRALDLAGKKSAEKSIPDCYKFNTVEVRLAVLQGLMDTDGTVDSQKGTAVSFSSSSRLLAEDVAFLVQSLGGTVGWSEKIPTYTHHGERRRGLLHYTLSVCLPPDVMPFRLPRKMALVRPKSKYRPTRYITEVVAVGRKPAQCIAVAHPSHLYVTDDFIVTHNTWVEAAVAMESKRLGLAKKPCIVIPNHMIAQFTREFLQLYPTARLLVASKDEMTPDARAEFVAKVATSDVDCVLMTHANFTKIPMSPTFERQLVQEEIRLYEQPLPDEDPDARKARLRTLDRWRNKLETVGNRMDLDRGVTFEELGLDLCIIDEAHAFKALPIESKNRGRAVKGSKRAEDLYLRCRYLDHRTPGRGLVFATGTPITNSLAEVYVLQTYLQRRRLIETGLVHFDAWAAMFGESVQSFELAPGGGYRLATRFAKFKNVPELTAMFREFADIKTTAELGLPVPTVKGGEPRNVAVAPGEDLTDYLQYLVERAEAIRNRQVRATEDNMLAVVGDGRKAALDLRLVDPTAPDDPNSKLSVAARDIAELWHRTKDQRATQLVFCDISTPKDEGFHIYGELRRKLIEQGVTPEEIAFAQDAKTDKAKGRLFQAVNRGQIRILIASTETAGIGTNVQERLLRLSHLDAGWRPCDMQQRDGRIVRQGNMWDEIEIFRYVTEKSFDAYIYQALERKARFIAQILSGDRSIREAEDVDSVTMSFATMKAIASGDPLVKEKAELESEVVRLQRLVRAEATQRWTAQRELAELPARLERAEARAGWCKKDVETRQDTTGDKFSFTLVDGTVLTNREEAGRHLVRALGMVDKDSAMWGSASQEVGQMGGLRVTLEKIRTLTTKMVLTGVGAYEVDIPYEARSGMGLVRRAEHVLQGLDATLTTMEAEVERLQKEEGHLKAFLDTPSTQKTMLDQILARLAEVDAQLGIAAADPQAVGDDEQPNVAQPMPQHAGRPQPPAARRNRARARQAAAPARPVAPQAGHRQQARLNAAVDAALQQPVPAPAPAPAPAAGGVDAVREAARERARRVTQLARNLRGMIR